MSAHAQTVERNYDVVPTDGVALPTPLAGEHDALATSANPGGLALLRGAEFAAALRVEDTDAATTSGSGLGLYAATASGGGLLPRFGFGLGLEWLRPPRQHAVVDPGQPFRFTLAAALGLGGSTGVGVSWHRFAGNSRMRGLDGFDLGWSTRIGRHLAIGGGVRDLAWTPSVAGCVAAASDCNPGDEARVQRRYQMEAVVRPFGRDLLDVAAGGRIGEVHGDVDAWGRASIRAARGVYLVGAFETRALRAFDESPSGTVPRSLRDARLTVGIELSLGMFGLSAFGIGLRDPRGTNGSLGGGFVASLSTVPRPSLLPAVDHIERVELSGALGTREVTALVVRLRSVARDPSVVGVVVTFDGLGGGWSQLQEIRNELTAIRRAGKKVFAYMGSGTSRDYYVASAADRIYIDPAGGIRLVGMASHAFYFRGAFDRIGVLPQFEKIGEYKTAPEQFTETGPTQVAAQLRGQLFDSLWSQWLAEVAAGRRMTPHDLATLVDQGPYTSADLSSDRRLVDAVATPDKVAQLIASELGGDYGVGVPPIRRPERWTRPAIAIIYVEGDITDGESKTIPVLRQSLAGGQTIAAAVVAARNDPSIAAIVLRLDSPGGSAVASELVAREVFATRGVKPIICSLSNVAASGAYFIAAACDEIYAQPMTITGSIGIFVGKFDLSGLLKKLDIGVDSTKRGKRADIDSWYRPYTDEERTVLMEKLRHMYDRFVDSVARGRKLTKDAVDAAGRGRVFTGEQARPLSLIDHFGGIGDAINDAKRRVGLTDHAAVDLREYPRLPRSFLGVVTQLLGVHNETASPIDAAIAHLVRGVGASAVVPAHVPQARLPFELDVGD